MYCIMDIEINALFPPFINLQVNLIFIWYQGKGIKFDQWEKYIKCRTSLFHERLIKSALVSASYSRKIILRSWFYFKVELEPYRRWRWRFIENLSTRWSPEFPLAWAPTQLSFTWNNLIYTKLMDLMNE